MITKKQLLDSILKKYSDITYDDKTDTLHYLGRSMSFQEIYDKVLKENGMSFKCLCDVHWENMSILECTECGTIIKYYYDEWFEPDFKCPVCTDYKTGFEYYTKEEIAENEELQAIIKIYIDLDKSFKEQDERRKKRNGLEDYQLTKPLRIKIGNKLYVINVLINSILNKNKLKGLRLSIDKSEKDSDYTWVVKSTTTIPLSIGAYRYHKNKDKYQAIMNKRLEQLKGKPLSQTLEEEARRKIKKPQ